MGALTGHREVAATATEALTIGPIPSGQVVERVIVTLSAAGFGKHTFTAVISQVNTANAADITGGLCLIANSNVFLNGRPAISQNIPTNTPASLSIETDPGLPFAGNWLILAITNGHASIVLNVTVALVTRPANIAPGTRRIGPTVGPEGGAADGSTFGTSAGGARPGSGPTSVGTGP